MLFKIISFIVIYIVISYIVDIVVNFSRYKIIKSEMNSCLYDDNLIFYIRENIEKINKLPQFMVNRLFKRVDKGLIFRSIKCLLQDNREELTNKILLLVGASKDLYEMINYKLPKKLFAIYIKPFLLKDPNSFQLKQYYSYLSDKELFEIALNYPQIRNWAKRVIRNKKLCKQIDFIGAMQNDI